MHEAPEAMDTRHAFSPDVQHAKHPGPAGPISLPHVYIHTTLSLKTLKPLGHKRHTYTAENSCRPVS